MVKRVGKRGDTLIEVLLAVGIFSMVAVAVVAVMSSGTSSAQTSLETTLAREEIDAQAEALRFIQSSYIAEKGSESESFKDLWEAITGKAVVLNDLNDTEKSNLLQYSPTSCSELYTDEGEARKRGFIINMRKISSQLNTTWNKTKLNDDMVIGGNIKQGSDYKINQASTYPHLIFGTKSNNTDDDELTEIDGEKTLHRAEGIYIIAVKDPNSTTIAGDANKSAYYDFYIRTCWYGTSDQTPSTISTVMRLYDPGIVE